MRTNRGYRHVDDDGSVAEPPPPPLSTSRPPPLAASSSYRAVAVEEDERGGTMSIKVLDVQGHTYSLTVASDATVAALKDQLVEVSQVERERQRIIHMGKVLQDGDTLASHKVQCGTTLHLFQRPKGVLPLPPPPLDPADPAAAARGSISAVAGIPGGVPHLTVHGGDYGSAGLFGDAAWQLDNARRGLRFLASFLFLVQTMQALEALAIITGPNDHTDRAVSFLIYAILLRSVMGMAVGALGVRASHGTEPAVLRLYFWGLVLTGIVAILIRADVLFDFVSGELPLPPVPPGSSSSSDDRGGGGGGGGRSSGSSSGSSSAEGETAEEQQDDLVFSAFVSMCVAAVVWLYCFFRAREYALEIGRSTDGGDPSFSLTPCPIQTGGAAVAAPPRPEAPAEVV